MQNLKVIPLFGNNYSVSIEGEVFRTGNLYRNSTMRPLKPSIVSGYKRVSLSHENRIKNVLVHRLMGYAFLGLTDELVINHKNGDRLDNRLENLEVCTQAQNTDHCCRELKHFPKHLRKLTPKDIIGIREDRLLGLSLKELAIKYGSKKSNISAIVNNKTWKIQRPEEPQYC